jgi:outer membrane lipopolysaccharide assembly protein LptE/RlpB
MRIAGILALAVTLLAGCGWRDAGIAPLLWASKIAQAGCEAARNCGTVDETRRRRQ